MLTLRDAPRDRISGDADRSIRGLAGEEPDRCLAEREGADTDKEFLSLLGDR